MSRLAGPAKLNAARWPVTLTSAQSSPHSALSRKQFAKYGRGAAGGGGEIKSLGPQPGDHSIIDDDARFIQHEPVARHAHLQIRVAAGIRPVEERTGLSARTSRFSRACPHR